MPPQEVVQGFKSTVYSDVFHTNWHNLKWRWLDFIPSSRPFKVLGLFILGYYLYAKDFFTIHAKKIQWMLPLLVCGLSFTLLTMYISGSNAVFPKNWMDILDKFIHEVGQITLALAYISVLAYLVDKFSKFFFFHILKNYGRMSMSSYIGHTLLGILTFYPIIGFDYFAQFSLEKIFYTATILLIIQFLFSGLWFNYFSFGPIEWLWRCATYKKWFPIKK